jgi:hypothetical protein
MNNLAHPRPEMWGKGKLYKFIEECWSNSIATVGHKNIIARRLAAIDDIFEELHHDFKPSTINQLVPAFLFFRAFSTYRSSVMVSLSLPTDGYALQRACLENAGYARLIATEPALGELWLKRDEDPNFKNRFTHRLVREAIEAEDVKLSQVYQELYERTIDFGAHPNEKSVLINVLRESLDTTTIKFLLLPGDGLALDHGLRRCAQVGICALKVLATVFREQFDRVNARTKIEKSSLSF